MAVVRTLVLLLLVASAVLFALYAGTGNARYKRLGIVIFKWTVLAALGFFLALTLDRFFS
ncbi:hypothetical protein [Ramlibacter montanisoli]|uniref:Uncharacterized protein n=1 Tax=Ramlibacter montanisoli TaxID=2732512 RepID=A0A849KQE9_9BURK|nr:hypothetical protein [Ramlibacter montanisoli]NNU44049.1 hypothetical protein [Ramlibacter montanisoli]